MPVSKIFELYTRCGRSLMDIGVNEAALPISEVDIALELFREQQWLVLGGDAYELSDNGRFKITYENWYYEGKD